MIVALALHLLWFAAGVVATAAAFFHFGSLLLREASFAVERRAAIRWLKNGARDWPYSVNASVAYDIARALEHRAHWPDNKPKDAIEQLMQDAMDEAVKDLGEDD